MQAQPSQLDSDDEEIRQLEKPLREELALGQSSNEAFRQDQPSAALPGPEYMPQEAYAYPAGGAHPPACLRWSQAVKHWPFMQCLCQSQTGDPAAWDRA